MIKKHKLYKCRHTKKIVHHFLGNNGRWAKTQEKNGKKNYEISGCLFAILEPPLL